MKRLTFRLRIMLTMVVLAINVSSFAQKAMMQFLDSVVTLKSPDNEKRVFAYDNNGNVILDAQYRWEFDSYYGTINNFRGLMKVEYAYDNNSNKTLEAQYEWDNQINDWKGFEKKEYAFDNNGDKILASAYSWDIVSGDWLVSYKNKYEYTYDNKNRLIKFISYNWDVADWKMIAESEWVYDNNDNLTLKSNQGWWDGNPPYNWHGTKTEYAYDSNNNLTLWIFSECMIINNWYGRYKKEYTYDANNKLATQLDYLTIVTDNNFILTNKIEYTYDSIGNLIMSSSTAWDNTNNIWTMWYSGIGYNAFAQQTEYTYDSNMNLIKTIEYKWDNGINNYKFNLKKEWTYDNNGNKTMEVQYEWNNGINNWVGGYNEKREWTYDSNNKITMKAEYDWDWNVHVWKGRDKYEYTYDNNYNLTIYVKYNWDDGIHNWKEDIKKEYVFDYSHSMAELVFPSEYSSLMLANMLTKAINYSWNGTAWVAQNDTATYYWSANNINVKALSGTITRPDTTLLNSGTVELYLVNSGQYTLKSTTNVSGSGTYMFTNVLPGKYIIKVTPNNSENAFPTYYGNTEIWGNATKITVGNASIQNLDITIIPLPQFSGNSSISGYVLQQNSSKALSKSKGSNPAPYVTVYLQRYQSALWSTLSYTLTNTDGYYEFTNIPAGTYRVIIDIPGLGMVSTPIIEVGENEDVIGTNYTITNSGIKVTEQVGIDNFETNSGISVYPNPTTGQLTIRTVVETWHAPSPQNIQIYDISGRVVDGWTYAIRPNNNEFTIDISHLQQGMYYLRVGNETVKIIKN